MNEKLICIVGPTAAGKTALGIKLAKKIGGEIVSADSRQIYRQLNIGTNKDIAKYGDIPYHLIDVIEPGEKYTVFDWLKDAKNIIENIFERGKVPIVVGGTGLYVQALTEGFELEQIKNLKLKIKNFSRQALEEKSLGELGEIYGRLRGKMQGVDIHNPRRLIRAIERAQEGIQPEKIKPNFEVLQIGISLPRPALYERIDKKVEEWFERGLVEEVGGLLNSGIDPEWLKSIGLNYRLVAEHILENNPAAIDELKQIIKFKTHALARRQLTWFRRFPEIKWTKGYTQAEKFAKNFLKQAISRQPQADS